MYGVNACPNTAGPPELPALGTLLVDTSRDNRVGEFRGVAGFYWSLRPMAAAPSGRSNPVTYGPRSP